MRTLQTDVFNRLKKEVSPMQNDIIRYGFIPLEAREKNVLFYIIHKIDRFKLTDNEKISVDDYENLELEPITINLAQMVNDLNLGKNYHIVRDSLEKLSETSIKLKYPNIKRETFIPLIAKADYIPEEGIIKIKFNQEAKPFLLPNPNNGNFTEIGTLATTMFKTTYASDIYMYLKMKRQFGENKISITMDEIYNKLRLSDYYKRDFNRFRTKILDKILEDFNPEYCDILIDKVEFERIGRKVGKIVFFTKYNKKFSKAKKSCQTSTKTDEKQDSNNEKIIPQTKQNVKSKKVVDISNFM